MNPGLPLKKDTSWTDHSLYVAHSPIFPEHQQVCEGPAGDAKIGQLTCPKGPEIKRVHLLGP